MSPPVYSVIHGFIALIPGVISACVTSVSSLRMRWTWRWSWRWCGPSAAFCAGSPPSRWRRPSEISTRSSPSPWYERTAERRGWLGFSIQTCLCVVVLMNEWVTLQVIDLSLCHVNTRKLDLLESKHAPLMLFLHTPQALPRSTEPVSNFHSVFDCFFQAGREMEHCETGEWSVLNSHTGTSKPKEGKQSETNSCCSAVKSVYAQIICTHDVFSVAPFPPQSLHHPPTHNKHFLLPFPSIQMTFFLKDLSL